MGAAGSVSMPMLDACIFAVLLYASVASITKIDDDILMWCIQSIKGTVMMTED